MSNRICIVCGVDISNQHHNAKMCPLCSAKKIGNLDAIVKIDPSYLNDMEENIHYVKCSYCGYVGRTLQYHLKSEHNMTSKEYETITGCLAMCSEEKAIRSKKFSGENNPGWKHGGKLSPWSYNSNKTKEEVDRCREKTIQSIQTTNKLNNAKKIIIPFNIDKKPISVTPSSGINEAIISTLDAAIRKIIAMIEQHTIAMIPSASSKPLLVPFIKLPPNILSIILYVMKKYISINC